MLKYCLSAAALKAFSISGFTRGAYRALGNTVGNRRRAQGQIPQFYLDRVARMLRIARTYGAPKHGDTLLELGTGWLHWEAITTRLFYDVRGVLFDVWDNRQMGGLKNYLCQLYKSLDKFRLDEYEKSRAKEIISEIQHLSSYDELYRLLGFEYIVDKHGRLDSLKTNSFDIAVSAGVLEHVHAQDVAQLIGGISSVLKPGGYSIQSINTRDHLSEYDSSVSPKQYLTYSDWLWRAFFNNEVQHINRLQRSDWNVLFETAGLELVEEQIERIPLSHLRIASQYRRYSVDDLACGVLDMVHRKPA